MKVSKKLSILSSTVLVLASFVGLFRYQNAEATIDSPKKITWLVFIALLYYASVRVFGKKYFNYKK